MDQPLPLTCESDSPAPQWVTVDPLRERPGREPDERVAGPVAGEERP